jgi:hypothetical protein
VTTNVIKFDNNNSTGEREKNEAINIGQEDQTGPSSSGMLKF